MRTRKNTLYVFNPVMFDQLYANNQNLPESGTIVRTIQPYGCPKNNTMNMSYVEVADSKEFVGLVCNGSLTKLTI